MSWPARRNTRSSALTTVCAPPAARFDRSRTSGSTRGFRVTFLGLPWPGRAIGRSSRSRCTASFSHAMQVRSVRMRCVVPADSGRVFRPACSASLSTSIFVLALSSASSASDLLISSLS
uniref:(northern house mosquito) hypothetical protein n=1 Tax=Culex pipiens TaxID=7175 RepID=A0A8D8CQ11_CULPI